jgi:hypothetical protein
MSHSLKTADKHYDMTQKQPVAARQSIIVKKLLKNQAITPEDLKDVTSTLQGMDISGLNQPYLVQRLRESGASLPESSRPAKVTDIERGMSFMTLLSQATIRAKGTDGVITLCTQDGTTDPEAPIEEGNLIEEANLIPNSPNARVFRLRQSFVSLTKLPNHSSDHAAPSCSNISSIPILPSHHQWSDDGSSHVHNQHMAELGGVVRRLAFETGPCVVRPFEEVEELDANYIQISDIPAAVAAVLTPQLRDDIWHQVYGYDESCMAEAALAATSLNHVWAYGGRFLDLAMAQNVCAKAIMKKDRTPRENYAAMRLLVQEVVNAIEKETICLSAIVSFNPSESFFSTAPSLATSTVSKGGQVRRWWAGDVAKICEIFKEEISKKCIDRKIVRAKMGQNPEIFKELALSGRIKSSDDFVQKIGDRVRNIYMKRKNPSNLNLKRFTVFLAYLALKIK